MTEFVDVLTWVLVVFAYLMMIFLVRGQLAGRLDKPKWKPALWLFVLLLILLGAEILLEGFDQRPVGRFLLILAGAYFSASHTAINENGN
ncbi:hypothetical protein [Streptococcus moroccensis]|uniref:Uncharacterized membrane protein YoaK (UPF0700 family) n=1 Tax=Streptococcus moroccensis TaxID=1451356 RepID=A0ABT9YNN7_9STRE|nr:hypothetical protein [Streptococcus moroccensis]MDQ0221507.1 uncharacterized membrane protein YoaK (UPF0700 family) [Streptococcus moroccensis]